MNVRELIKTFGAFSAFVVGYFLWSFILIIRERYGVIGALIFFSPIIGWLGPLVIQKLNSGNFSSAVWIIAIAPIAGVLNFVLCIFVAGITHGFLDKSLPIIAVIAIWAVPAILRLLSRKTEVQDKTP
jgi:hypothetical protein